MIVPKPDLVWSGSEVPGVHARDTRRVYEELLGSAEHSVWASSYAYFDGPRAFEVLARRMDALPDLRVTLLLNIQRRRGDTTAAEELVRRFADRFWERDWPGSSRPRVYFDPRSLELDGPAGVLHAKAIVTDDEVVFVTSANLTEAALDRNIEIGLLVRDRTLAASVSSHFRTLISSIARCVCSGPATLNDAEMAKSAPGLAPIPAPRAPCPVGSNLLPLDPPGCTRHEPDSRFVLPATWGARHY